MEPASPKPQISDPPPGSHPPWSRIRGLLLAACTLAGICVILATLLALLSPWFWWADNLTHFRGQYCLLLLLPLLVWVRKHAWKPALAGLIALGWNAAFLTPLYWPQAPPADHTRATLTILLSNVLTQNHTPERVVAYLRQTDADVVLLQEIDEAWVTRLKPWSIRYPHRMEYAQPDNFGIGLYSRQELLHRRFDPLDEKTTPTIGIRFHFDGLDVQLLAIHTLPPVSPSYWSTRNQQLESIGRWCRGAAGTGMVVGDLNITPFSPFFTKLMQEGGLTHARRGFGLIPTWPANGPAFWIPLDTVLVQEQLRVVGIHRGPDVGSDHHPILVRIQRRSS